MIRITILIAAAMTAPMAQAQICRTSRCIPVQKQIVVQEVAHAVPQVFVINNVPSVPQGSVTYSSNYSIPAPGLDLNLVVSQLLQLRQSAAQTESRVLEESMRAVTQIVELDRRRAEIEAQGRAAAEVLKEAGLGGSVDDSIEVAATPSLAQQFCGKCHVGTDAKAGFRLDQDFDVAMALARITTRDASKRMPPKGQPQPSDADRLALIGEMLKSVQVEK